MTVSFVTVWRPVNTWQRLMLLSVLRGLSSCADPTPFCDEDNDICVECLGDSDCDDSVFCNGFETCVAGSCQAGTPACPPLSICDEASGECLCSSDADCDDGLYCNGVETCGSFSGTCDLSFNYSTDSPCLDCRPNLDDCDCDELTDSLFAGYHHR